MPARRGQRSAGPCKAEALSGRHLQEHGAAHLPNACFAQSDGSPARSGGPTARAAAHARTPPALTRPFARPAGGSGSPPVSPEGSPSRPYDAPAKPLQGAAPALTSSRRRHSLSSASRADLMPGSMGSCTSLSPVLENKPDLSSHLPPAFSLGIIAGGEPGPPPPLHPLPLGAAGGHESGAHGWPRGKAADGDCAKAAAWGGERGGALRLPQLLGFAALLLLAVVASLAVWPHVSAHGGSGSPHALHAAAAGLGGPEVLYAAGGATGVEPGLRVPNQFLVRVLGGARASHGTPVQRLEALTAAQARGRGGGLGLAGSAGEAGETGRAGVAGAVGVAAERAQLAQKAAEADGERIAALGQSARSRLADVRGPAPRAQARCWADVSGLVSSVLDSGRSLDTPIRTVAQHAGRSAESCPACASCKPRSRCGRSAGPACSLLCCH